MASHGIINQSSCPHTLQQNGVAERKHHHLVDTARTLLINAHASFRFWGDAILAVCYLINHMPSSVLGNEIPYFCFLRLYTLSLFMCLDLRVLYMISLLAAINCLFELSNVCLWAILKPKRGIVVIPHLHIVFMFQQMLLYLRKEHSLLHPLHLILQLTLLLPR